MRKSAASVRINSESESGEYVERTAYIFLGVERQGRKSAIHRYKNGYGSSANSADGYDGMGDVVGVVRSVGKLVFLLQGAGRGTPTVHGRLGTGWLRGHYPEPIPRAAACSACSYSLDLMH
jgi:hypothetical protein